MKVIIKIPFNIVFTKFNNRFREARLTKSWIQKRIDIFMRYTYKSLKAQTNKAFMAMVEYDQVTMELIKEALQQHVEVEEEVGGLGERLLEINDQVIFTDNFELSVEGYVKKDDEFMMLHLDSDNMIDKGFIQEVYDKSGKEILVARSGYAYSVNSDEVYRYYHPIPDTFYTYGYKVEEYMRGYRHLINFNVWAPTVLEFLGGYTYELITENEFIVLVHDESMTHEIERMIEMETIKFKIDESEKNKIKERFNIVKE